MSEQIEFDFAVSFAGKDRELVRSIVEKLKDEGLRIFYDEDYQAELWGEDLTEFFDSVYRKRSRFAIIFISRNYREKMWTRIERRSALDRAAHQDSTYLLPVRLDDTDLPGLRSVVGYLDARTVGADGIFRAAVAKAGMSTSNTVEILRVPRGEVERQQLLALRPPGWEYLLLGAELLRGRDLLIDKYRDHQLRYAPPTNRHVEAELMPSYLTGQLSQMSRLIDTLNDLLGVDPQEAAFGLPGEPGDATLITHLAGRWTAIFEHFMDWSAAIRGTSSPEEWRSAMKLLAQYADDPIERYYEFVDEIVRRTDEVPTALAEGRQLRIDINLTLSIPPALSRAMSDELARHH